MDVIWQLLPLMTQYFSGLFEPMLHQSYYRDATNVASPSYSQLLRVTTGTFPADGMARASASAFFAADEISIVCAHAQIFSTLCLMHPGAVELPLPHLRHALRPNRLFSCREAPSTSAEPLEVGDLSCWKSQRG
jgi:hypothetical protein